MKFCINCSWYLEQKETLYDYCMMKQPHSEFPENENGCIYYSTKLSNMNCQNCRLHVPEEDCRCLEKRIEHAHCCKNIKDEYVGSCLQCLSIK
jgi:hypothetical protein